MKLTKTNISIFLSKYNSTNYNKELTSNINSYFNVNNLKATKYLLYMTYIAFNLEVCKSNFKLNIHMFRISIDGFNIPCSKKCSKLIDKVLQQAFNKATKTEFLEEQSIEQQNFFISLLKKSPLIFEKTVEQYLDFSKNISIKHRSTLKGLHYEILVTNELSKLFNLKDNNHCHVGPDAICLMNNFKINFEISVSVYNTKKSSQLRKWIDLGIVGRNDLNIFIGGAKPQLYHNHINLKFNKDYTVCKDENYKKLVKISEDLKKKYYEKKENDVKLSILKRFKLAFIKYIN